MEFCNQHEGNININEDKSLWGGEDFIVLI